ncbi:Homeodomain-like protein [Gymnopus androsaceus JB14]|uniref:Homeodomain-like protein n=1 Tax=Gymnopus androsaceus JB14 TaxID=1447944 RepID=A0A6A4HB44_9AGAR|nr:Homeodomain-like protein [Gymnopus androsaceus JB14]
MSRSLSQDIRRRIVHWRIEEGREIHEIAQLAGCCDNTVYTILRMYRESGELHNVNAIPYGRPRILNSGDKAYILSILKAMPSLFLDEIQDCLWNHRYVDVSLSTISRALRGM